MIRKLQIRFIRIVMEAFFAVLLVLLVGLNCVNRYRVYDSIDTRLEYLAEGSLGPPRGMIASTPEELQRWLNLNNAGIMSESSYFLISGIMAEDIRQQQLSLLSLMINEDAAQLVSDILDSGNDFGDVAPYRYYVAARGSDYRIVFLFCDNEFSSMRSLLQTSILVSLGCLLLVLVLVTLLSKKAIRPFAENIENQKRFISNASHELKTPLGVIISDLDMQILEGGSTEWLENAQIQADHLTLLVEQLTTYSLLEEKKQDAAELPVDVSALGEEILSDFRPLALSRGQELSGEIAPGVSVTGNEDALRTLLSVLLDNAVKYAPEGGAVRLRIFRDKKAVIEVENTCDGISADELSHIFERFYRVPKHRASQQGSGLGLSIAQDIVSLYGGSIRAAGRDGAIVFTAEF